MGDPTESTTFDGEMRPVKSGCLLEVTMLVGANRASPRENLVLPVDGREAWLPNDVTGSPKKDDDGPIFGARSAQPGSGCRRQMGNAAAPVPAGAMIVRSLDGGA